jgi:integrase
MGTIVARAASDGRKNYTAQILRKKAGTILHREAKTFGTKRLAEAWIRNRENALDSPGGIELARSPDPLLKDAIDAFIQTNRRPFGKTQKNLYELLKQSDLAERRCSEILAKDIVAYGKKLADGGRTKATVGTYISALGSIFKTAKAAFGYRIDRQQWEDAATVLRRLDIIGYSNKRERRPTLEELDRLMTYFVDRSVRMHNHGVAPMHRVIAYAIFSTRRLEEIIRQDRADVDFENLEVMVRQMKDPRNKTTNDVRCELTEEACLVAKAMKPDRDDNRLFPFNYGQVQQAFSNACVDLGIEDLHFHDLRHEGISRLFEMGRTIPQVASVSGHKNWNSLKRYSHLRQKGDKFAGWKWMPVVTTAQHFQIQP